MRESSPTSRPSNTMPARRIEIFPVILAVEVNAEFSRALARFGGKPALQIAIENCAGLQPAVVVTDLATGKSIGALGRRLEGVRRIVSISCRGGQIGSIREGLKCVPRKGAFMIYPVDYPLLTPGVIQH